jgi:hypothetical protein
MAPPLVDSPGDSPIFREFIKMARYLATKSIWKPGVGFAKFRKDLIGFRRMRKGRVE